MLKNCGLANINASFGQKGKKRNWEVGQDFFQTSNYIRAIFWKSIAYIHIFVIIFIACAIQYHRSVFIFIVRRILSTQLLFNVSGHSLPTKLYIDPLLTVHDGRLTIRGVARSWRLRNNWWRHYPLRAPILIRIRNRRVSKPLFCNEPCGFRTNRTCDRTLRLAANTTQKETQHTVKRRGYWTKLFLKNYIREVSKPYDYGYDYV